MTKGPVDAGPPSGGKLWRFKYRVHNKEQLLSLGTYPDVGLKEARTKRDAAASFWRRAGIPVRKEAYCARGSGECWKHLQIGAEEYIAKQGREGRAEATLTKARWHLSC